mmetsp:Transcript_11502/g.29705  ORF Transcript_11502/g.29705 Transcript_11502/m.29705 type:complete len:232 (-) Transcript_11502:1847-2542(-)
MVPHHPRQEVPRKPGGEEPPEGGTHLPWKIRRLCDLLRDGYQGERAPEEVPLAVHHHRRGAPHQERELAAVARDSHVPLQLQAADHGNPAAEQPARAVGPAQLFASGRLLLGREVRRVVSDRFGVPEGRGRPSAAQAAEAVPPEKSQGRGGKGPAPEEGDHPEDRSLGDAAQVVQAADAEGHRRHQRRRRALAPPEHRHAAAQVLQPPLPLPRGRARPSLHHRHAPDRERG